jgi:2-amino-4-hydroxy-6-hydroxymethyldihydropteridine diphosphokinase
VILIGLGGNLSHELFGPPQAVIEAALAALDVLGVAPVARSPFYATAPVPASDQPDFVNAVAAVATGLAPADLLQRLHTIEAAFGRVRRQRNEARILDLDLLAYDDLAKEEGGVSIPHPRLHERAFVLLPLRDVAPGWRHPALGRSVEELIAALPEAALQGARAMTEISRP